MPGGRPPKPVEQKRKTGRTPGRDSGGRKLPDAPTATVHAFPAAVPDLPATAPDVPELPDTLLPGGPGARRWARLWREGKSWLNPGVDHHILVRLCEAEDLRHAMKQALNQEGFYVVGSQGQLRPNPLIDKVSRLDDQITKYESLCGLTPSDRGRLGVGEVKPAGGGESPLQAILARAAGRGGGA